MQNTLFGGPAVAQLLRNHENTYFAQEGAQERIAGSFFWCVFIMFLNVSCYFTMSFCSLRIKPPHKTRYLVSLPSLNCCEIVQKCVFRAGGVRKNGLPGRFFGMFL